MAGPSIPTGDSPKLTISAYGNLRLIGWDRAEIALRSSGESEPGVEQVGDEVTVNCPSDCLVNVPRRAAIHVEAIYGNATMNGLDGELHIDEIGANLNLQQVGPTRMGTIRGNLLAETVKGDLEARAIYGNATLRSIAGRLSVEESIRGNLILSQANGVSATVQGNASLDITPAPQEEFHIAAKGNIDCQLPPETHASVNLSSNSQSMRLDLPDFAETLETTNHAFTLGDGGAILNLNAHGRIHLTGHAGRAESWGDEESDLDADLTGIAADIRQQIDLQMEHLERQLNQRLAHLSEVASTAGVSTEEIDGIVQHAREAGRRAQVRAQNAAQRAQEKLGRRMEKARREARKKARAAARRSAERGLGGVSVSSSAPLIAQGEPVSEEEMLVILRMLEANQITAAEAHQLLEALEGSDG